MAAAVVTGAIEQEPDPSAVGGSTESFADLTNSVFASEEVKIDRPISGGSNPVSAATSFASTAADTATHLFRSAALISPIWEGWAQPIRWGILVLQMPLVLLFALEGAKVLSGFIPFT